MAAVGNYNPIGIQIRDYAGKAKGIRLYSGEITAVTLPGFLTKYAALTAALDNVLLGVRAKESWGEETVVTNDRATAEDARIVTELLVRVQGATSEKPWSFRIPAVDYEAFNYADPPAADNVILTGGGASAATTALIAAIEDLCKMPDDNTEAVQVVGMTVVR